MNVISALIDFTDTSKTATAYACWLAEKQNAKINLLHICPEDDYDVAELEKKIIDFTGIDRCGLQYNVAVGDGHIQEKIPQLLDLSHSDFVIIGTHGAKSIFATTVGAEVVKLTQRIGISALVVQDRSPQPGDHLHKVLFPIGPHKDFMPKIEAAIEWAKLADLEFEVFCLSKEDGSLSKSIEQNLELTRVSFEKAGLNFKEVVRSTQSYSVGFGRDIVEEGKAWGADLIVSMSHPSEENSYFGNVDKTHILLNSSAIPVLCVTK